MSERILCIVAHPDDETFGPGGTLARHAKSGDHVAIVAMADGLASRGGVSTANIAERHGAFRKACAILGTEDVYVHQFADNMMDGCALLEIVRFIERHIERVKPTIVYTHWKGDLNVDHRACHDAVNVACRPQPGCTVRRVLYFEVPCSTTWGTGFEPNYFVDIQSTIKEKNYAMDCYEIELRDWPHPRSIIGINTLSKWRGASVSLEAAEAFMVGRWVE